MPWETHRGEGLLGQGCLKHMGRAALSIRLWLVLVEKGGESADLQIIQTNSRPPSAWGNKNIQIFENVSLL